MQVIRPESSEGARLQDIGNPLRYFTSQQAEKSAAPEDLLTAKAVTQVKDRDTLSPAGQSVAELKAIIERLSAAESPDEVKSALEALQAFVQDKTNASMIGGALGELAAMASEALDMIEKDPTALGSGFSFDFNASFVQQTVDSESFYQNVTSFSFSFSFRTDNTAMNGALDFSESLSFDGEQLSYSSSENISVNMVTFNANLDTNPILNRFLTLTEKLTGIDMAGLFEPKEDTAEETIGAYRKTSYETLLQINYSRTEALLQLHNSLIERLREFFEESTDKLPGTPLEALEATTEPEAA